MVIKPDKLDSGGRLINGDPKPGKKMKKRRELDALVGKTRRKNRGGHELLRNDSESSEIEEFSSADSKITVRNRRGGSACSTCLTILAFLLLLACIVACAGLIWVHLELKAELDTLRGRVQSVESSNEGLPSEWQGLKSDVEEWRKGLEELRTGAISNLTLLSTQVNQLKADLIKIKERLDQKPDSSVTAADEGLAHSMADIDNLKTKTSDLEKSTADRFTAVQDRLTQLEGKVALLVVSPDKPASSPASPAADLPGITSILSEMTDLRASVLATNLSLSDRMDGLAQQLTLQQGRLEVMEKETAKTPVTLNTTAITLRIREQLLPYVRALVSNATLRPEAAPDTALLDTIKQQVENITHTVYSLEKQIGAGSSAPRQMDDDSLQLVWQQVNTTDANLMRLNDTVSWLSLESGRLMDLWLNEKNTIVKLGHEMAGVRRYLDTLPGPHDNLNGDVNNNSTAAPDTTKPTTNAPVTGTTKRDKRDTALDKELDKLFSN